MDKNSFENRIKIYFHNRKIQPGPASWDRLDVMLSMQETEISNRFSLRKVISAAAAVVAGLLVIFYFLFPDNSKPELKSDMVLPIAVEKAGTSHLIPDLYDSLAFANKADGSNTHINTVNTYLKGKIKNTGALNRPKTHSELDDVEIKDELLTINKTGNQAEKSVLADNFGTKFKSKSHKKLNINAKTLLNHVEQSIASDDKAKLRKEIRLKYGIEPSGLLKKAEMEANETFMVKVWKTIQEKSEPVIVAVAERNLTK